MKNVNDFDKIFKDTTGKYIVRLYDGFDNLWIDIGKPVSLNQAKKIWLEKTNNGKDKINFNDIDYYDIFPEDTKMIYS